MDKLELACRYGAWVSVGVLGGAFWSSNADLFQWALLSAVICTAWAVDFCGQWIPTHDFWELGTSNILIGKSTCRLRAWTSWCVAIISHAWYWFWIGGVLWMLHACGLVVYVFDTLYKQLFEKNDRTLARRMFRIVLHDMVSGFLIVLLGATLDDVFDGDADDSQWRSLFSGAVIFQIFFILWSHMDLLHVSRDQRCCSDDMRALWITLTRFISFGAVLMVLLTRAHENKLLVDMEIDDVSFGIFLGACVILTVTSRGVKRLHD